MRWAIVIATVFSLARVRAITIQTNVDTEEPSVITSPAPSGDGFGWTALFHRIEVAQSGDSLTQVLGKTRVVIGAPKGTFPGGFSFPEGLGDVSIPRERQTGLVYSCTVGTGVCEGVRGDTSRYLSQAAIDSGIADGRQSLPGRTPSDFFLRNISEGRLFDQAPNTNITVTVGDAIPFEFKTGQLMGSTLYSSGDNIVACAPSWATSDNLDTMTSNPRGICFIGDRSLSNFLTRSICGFLGGSGTASQSSYCLGGYSATIVNDRLVVGGPGRESFLGTVYDQQISTAEFLPQFNAYYEPSVPADRSLHTGFQVTQGYITSNNREQPTPDVIASIPRWDGTTSYLGRVVVLPASQLGTSSNFTNFVMGEQTAEFFGYSIATCELIGDGYDALLVGAPMYTDLDMDAMNARMVKPEVGRLYVFFNAGGSLSASDPVILTGRVAYGRFGFAVANVGDLNADGHGDFVVSAPYEPNEGSSNTGAVYVYYGKNTRQEFMNQMPQRISAMEVVASTTALTQLQSFGFSINGDLDVDLNRHNDFLVGSPDDQAVIVLRTRPFVNVTVEIADVNPVDLDDNPTFMVTVTARYTSANIRGTLDVRFNLRERSSTEAARLFFSDGDSSDDTGEGEFNFLDANVSVINTIQVYAETDIFQLSPYQLQLSLIEFERDLPQVSGRQPITDDLSAFPRLRLLGNSTFAVEIIDPCQDDGCTSDVVLNPLIPEERTIIAGGSPSVQFTLTHFNRGPEDGRNLTLVISDIPTEFFRDVSLEPLNATDPPIICILEDARSATLTKNASCRLQNRLVPGEYHTSRLRFFTTDTIIGNEAPVVISMEITVNDMEGNRDVNLANNQQSVRFSFDSQADISISMDFSPMSVEYAAAVPTTTGSGPATLGEAGPALSIRVGNAGPSTIQSSSVVINFPSQSPPVTGTRHFLYPTSLQFITGNLGMQEETMVNCNITGLDPRGLGEPPQLISGRRRRSTDSLLTTSGRAKRNAAKSRENQVDARVKRQATTADAEVTFNCDNAMTCTSITCNIEKLTPEGVRFTMGSFIDEEFYSANANSRMFSLTATGQVRVTSDFQIPDDDPDNNRASGTVTLGPPAPEDGRGSLVHVILWPTIGGIIILVVLVILLYCLGFFRRKKRTEDGEIEGDFTAPEPTKPEKPMVAELGAEATTV